MLTEFVKFKPTRRERNEKEKPFDFDDSSGAYPIIRMHT